jgi:hypothetical protein
MAMIKKTEEEARAVENKIVEEVDKFVGAPMTAKPEVLGGGLIVQIQSRYFWRGEMLAIDDKLPDPKPYDDSVEVTVELTTPEDGYSTFADSKYTDKEGEVTWNQIPAGGYTITVSTPEGFRLAEYSVGKCGEKADEPEPAGTPPLILASVCDDEATTVEVFLLPLLSAVDVLCFYDQDRSGDPTRKGQTAITSLTTSFRMQGRPVVAHRLCDVLGQGKSQADYQQMFPKHPIAQLLGPALVRALQTHPDYTRVYVMWKTGTVTALTDSPILATFPGLPALALQAEAPNGTLTYLSRGQLAALFVGYEEAEAEIHIAAFLEEECPCEPCSPAAGGRPVTKRTPLPGVTFQLYLGSPQGEPYQQATTVGSAPHLFTNLPPATNYHVIASAWPTSFGGSTQIQPRQAGGVSGPHSVSAAFPTKIDFYFASCLSRVTGIVTDGQAGTGVPNVPLLLTLSGGSQSLPLKATSNSKGEYEFNNVPAGNYLVQIEREKIFRPGGKVLEVPAAAQVGYAITVPACGTVSAPVIQLDDDVHRIFGTATAPDGSILPFLRIEIQDQNGRVKVVTQTDANGQYSALVPQAGFYLVVPQINNARQIPAQVNSEVQIDIMAAPSGTPSSQQAANKASQVQESEVDLQAYPVLTEEVPTDVVSRPPSGGGGGGGIAPIGKMAENAIRDVLSWRTKTDDPKSFILALNQSFALSDVEGHTEFKWTPRTYTVQTDMGAITGAQASIYNRAKVALDQSLPLLDGLYALLPVLEQEDLDSTRDMVKSLFTDLVNDLGIEGGPRIPRVDQLFRLLIGYPVPLNSEAAHDSSQLGILRQRFNLKREFITTIADEQNLTNYLIVVDYLISLNNSWINEKKYFAHSGTTAQPYFGTQLVLLSRSLDVVAQAVKDVEFAMDSVFISAAERQTTLLDFTSIDKESSLFIAELLDWVNRAASDELPAQLQDSGKDAIYTVTQVAGDLHKFVRAAIIPNQPLNGLPPGYRTPRVQRALRLLAESLSETLKLASQIKAPAFPIETGRIPPALI